MASRMSYLGVVAEKAIAHFRLAVAPTGGGSENIWFEAAGIPLKWQLPIGVLIDAVRSSTAATLLLLVLFRTQLMVDFTVEEESNDGSTSTPKQTNTTNNEEATGTATANPYTNTNTTTSTTAEQKMLFYH